MKRKSVAAAGITLLLGQAVLILVGPVHARISRKSTLSTECGHERWVVKTLQDKPVLHSVQPGTIAQLITVTKPLPLPGTRAPFEFNVFKVTAKVTSLAGACFERAARSSTLRTWASRS